MAELHTDFPERFEERRHLSGLAPDGSRRDLELEEHWFHKGGVVLKFAGVDSINDAETLARWEVQIPREARTELEAGAAYVSEIVGCQVWLEDGQRLLGTVSDVQFGAGEAPLLVVQLPGMALPVPGREKEVLVPYARSVCEEAGFCGAADRDAVAGRVAGSGCTAERRREAAAEGGSR